MRFYDIITTIFVNIVSLFKYFVESTLFKILVIELSFMSKKKLKIINWTSNGCLLAKIKQNMIKIRNSDEIIQLRFAY